MTSIYNCEMNRLLSYAKKMVVSPKTLETMPLSSTPGLCYTLYDENEFIKHHKTEERKKSTFNKTEFPIESKHTVRVILENKCVHTSFSIQVSCRRIMKESETHWQVLSIHASLPEAFKAAYA